ncbi:MAG TPA: serine/threonine-protein kinase [Gemmatimonadales bacterium]|nr:serine/threonine-protein kinase [Gemmatimonadales bacterium]
MNSPFFERLRETLAPDFELIRELGVGGMGTVHLARDVALDVLVAVKVLRPELATAKTVERFVREARILARLRHPNIVAVHKVAERGGLHFYTMDYLNADTLEARLARQGRLGHEQARKLGRDLLDALETAHRAGVIHRDVKPANVFLVGRRAVLTDFGIARQVSAEPLTDTGVTLGTAAYMPPEQFVGIEANERSDLYSAGMVIYEAFTGRRWPKRAPEDGDWSHVPFLVARVLRRALALAPERRWADARAFRRALWWTRVWKYYRNTVGVAVGALLLGVLLRPIIDALFPPQTFHIRVDRPRASPGIAPWLADSLACGLAQRLDAYPELSARCSLGLGRLWRGGSRIRPQLESLENRLRIRLVSDVAALDTIAVFGAPDDWRALADTLAYRGFGALLGTRDLLERSVPGGILPKTPEGLHAFQQAEGLFAQARWDAARAAYAAAAALDSTCWLCFWRQAEVARWFDLQDDPRDSVRYLSHAAAFPIDYQTLMRAQRQPESARLDSLDALTRRRKDFFFGQWRRGDELLHRGPLVGRPRREALEPFEEVMKLREAKVHQAFWPALHHLVWLHIAEGDSADAAAALDSLERLGPLRGSPSFAAFALVELAYAWRFLDSTAAMQRTDALVRAARAEGFAALDAGARYLPAFGAWQGALAFANRLLQEPGFERSAGLARVLAQVSLGRPDTATTLARGLASRFPELTVFTDELAAATLLFDADSTRATRAWPALRSALAGDADPSAAPAEPRQRAAWMLGVLDRARGGAPDPANGMGLGREPAAHALSLFLEGAALAARGREAAALTLTRGLAELPVGDTEDPFFRAVLHLSRAEWYARAGRAGGARGELVWAENSDVLGYPTGDPQPAEVDWAFAPLAAWRLAGVSERAGGRREDACRAYRVVVRAWSAGEPRYRARADSAAHRLTALACARAS